MYTFPTTTPAVATSTTVTATSTAGTILSAVATSTEEASTTLAAVPPSACAPYLTEYLAAGRVNDPAEVRKLQSFLNEWENAGIAVSGAYDAPTVKAVSDFQLKYASDILKKSWGAALPSGDVYITTRKKINDLYCGRHSDFSQLSYLHGVLLAMREGSAADNLANADTAKGAGNGLAAEGTTSALSLGATSIQAKIASTASPAATGTLPAGGELSEKAPPTVGAAVAGLGAQFWVLFQAVGRAVVSPLHFWR